MELKQDNLVIRHATIHDAKILCNWWNDGKVMAHAGFPDGINTTEEKIIQQISEETDDTTRRWIIEINNEPSGEMNYRNKGDNTAEIGIKICDLNKQEKGYGTRLLKMFIKYLFEHLGYEKIILDTKINNKRAQHVYETIGFKKIGMNEDAINYELTKTPAAGGQEMVRAVKKNLL
ncbi:MAG: GNAT family N-acetyltransferase [Treponema sp.]|jgi:RimJ/RimL family protein N-acetyltransferase|nr:GNAT family N-acetyltransferase [Treponema sp.]